MGKKSIMRILLALGFFQVLYTLFTIVIFVLGTILLIRNDVIISPDKIEEDIMSIEQMAANGSLEADSIPAYIEYAKVSLVDEEITGTINDEKLINEVCEKGEIVHRQFMNSITYRYLKGNSDSWILGYKSTVSQFSSSTLRKIFPSADFAITLFFFLILGGGFLLILKHYRNSLNNELKKITGIRNTIMEENNTSQVSSNIKEVDEILKVLCEMEEAVKESTKKQAMQAKALEDGIQALTHDIQTPATVVSGNLELLEETNIDDKQKEYLAYAQGGIHRITDYVNELKELIKLEPNFNRYDSFDQRFVEDLISIASQIAILKDIKMEIIKKDVAVDLLIEQKEIKKAFQNIVANAVEVSSEASVLQICFEKDRTQYMVSVIDSGRGFSRESMKKATQKFYSENKARNDNHYGLGLSISDKIMKAHGGEVRIENVKKKDEVIGSKVSLVFPFSSKTVDNKDV